MACCLRCYGDSPAVFVGGFVVVDWNRGLVFALGQLIAVLRHQLQRSETDDSLGAAFLRRPNAETLGDKDEKWDV